MTATLTQGSYRMSYSTSKKYSAIEKRLLEWRHDARKSGGWHPLRARDKYFWDLSRYWEAHYFSREKPELCGDGDPYEILPETASAIDEEMARLERICMVLYKENERLRKKLATSPRHTVV